MPKRASATPHERSLPLDRTYIQLLDGGASLPIFVRDDFWDTIDERTELHEGRLLGVFDMTGDPGHEEMHPAGDEVLVLHSGAVDVVLHLPEGERVVKLRDRGACIVPKGVWHTQRVHAPSVMMFVTPGKGTAHRARRERDV